MKNEKLMPIVDGLFVFNLRIVHFEIDKRE